MTIVIDLLRHGKVDGQPALYGKTDVDVTNAGFDAMLSQSQSLDITGKVFTSPLMRCRNLALTVDATAQVVWQLAEMDFGLWDGIPFDEFEGDWDKLEAFWLDPGANTPTGGESLRDFHNRVLEGWHEVVEQCVEGQNLVVCHGGVIRVILAHILNVAVSNGRWFTSLTISNASLTRITMSGDINSDAIVSYINKEFS